ncbi:MAG: hypothetical protein K2N05_07880 [Muribaculaceae bacterium]|nr:hypothetical protein [Muribaculaceae bacterium]
MKKLTLVSLLFLSASLFCVAPAEARSSRSKAAAKVKAITAKKKISTVRIKSVVDKIENGALSQEDTFEKTLAKVNKFFLSTMDPFIASNYPAKTSLPLPGKAELLYQEVQRYIDNTLEYSENTFSMGAGMSDIAWANQGCTFAYIMEIEKMLPNEKSKKAWYDYCSVLTELSNVVYETASSNAVCSMGAGSFILTEDPAILNKIQTSLQTLLKQDMRALKGEKIASDPNLKSRALLEIMKQTEESSYDPEIYADVPDTAKDDLKKERTELLRLIPECEKAHEKWVETLPDDIRPLMSDNLSVLLTSPIWGME